MNKPGFHNEHQNLLSSSRRTFDPLKLYHPNTMHEHYEDQRSLRTIKPWMNLYELSSSSTSTNDSYEKYYGEKQFADETKKIVCKGVIIFESTGENTQERKIKRFASTIMKASPPTKNISLPSFLQ